MLLGSLRASMFENTLARKEVMIAERGNNNMDHMDENY